MRLPLTARHLFDTGSTPADTYATLARRTRQPLRSARAVCTALGIPAAETQRRLDDCYDALLANPRPGTENDTGELLEALGVFDIPKPLDATELAVVDLFLAAIDAMGGIRAGHQHGLARWFTTGNLTAAYLSLAAARPRPTTGNPTHYWTTLTTAGELLLTTTPDPRLKPALTHCRTQAQAQAQAAHTTHP
ncbi:hypothetical protein [Kitasatospora sp. NBC_01300]|uniref:hypothetical protein n=1 Tax=Kitasatospora sp. NBC_01300 TaxID=2903574 RepID=UPI00352CA259|nr:hypothetical protein OG556_23835 [Kitasatospora sp. NBC_01300]